AVSQAYPASSPPPLHRCLFSFSFPLSLYPPVLHSFPTRRSSDLAFSNPCKRQNIQILPDSQLRIGSQDDDSCKDQTKQQHPATKIGRAHVCTPVTFRSRMPSSA